MSDSDKRARYARLLTELEGLLSGGDLDDVAVMATCACVLHRGVPQASWTGFYRVVAPRLLRVGPYQGPVGCLEIPFDRGVCGAAAREERTQVIADVHAFPGHIACDSSARSEIVVPVLGAAGALVAVLDLDSHEPAAFDQLDSEGLEKVADLLRPLLKGGA